MNDNVRSDGKTESFTNRMRKRTSNIHNISDALVQSKFLLGLVDDDVLFEGILVFYRVFEYLEGSMNRLSNANVGKFKNEQLFRVKFIEQDLEMFYGKEWRSLEALGREPVRNYVRHLERLERTEPDLLIAYIYHLYLGLLSGGRILNARRRKGRIPLTTFDTLDVHTVSQMKKFVKETTERIAATLDSTTTERLLDESLNVFRLNCELIRTISTAPSVRKAIRKAAPYVVIIVAVAVATMVYVSSRMRAAD